MTLLSHEKEVLDRVRGPEVAELALELALRRSPDGYEEEVGRFILDWLQRYGFEVSSQLLAPGRFNAVGALRGTGQGLSLLFNSHMDSEYQFGDDDFWRHRDFSRVCYQAWIDGDRVYGRDVINDKGPMACFMMAARAIKESGVQLPGDLILTMVVGEMSLTPVDEFHGPKYLGIGCGSDYLVKHGVTADYALVAETSDYIPTSVQTGDARFKITVLGKTVLTTLVSHGDRLEEDSSTVVKMAAVIQALHRWARDFEVRHRYEFTRGNFSGACVPKVNISAIRGGLPYWTLVSAGVCSLYINVYFSPDLTADQVKEELEGFLQDSGIEVEVEMYAAAPGTEGYGVERLLETIERGHSKVFGDKLPPRKIPDYLSSMRRDVPDFTQAGIPAVTYGPPAAYYSPGRGREEYLTIQDLETTARLYALIALDICGQKKKTAK